MVRPHRFIFAPKRNRILTCEVSREEGSYENINPFHGMKM